MESNSSEVLRASLEQHSETSHPVHLSEVSNDRLHASTPTVSLLLQQRGGNSDTVRLEGKSRKSCHILSLHLPHLLPTSSTNWHWIQSGITLAVKLFEKVMPTFNKSSWETQELGRAQGYGTFTGKNRVWGHRKLHKDILNIWSMVQHLISAAKIGRTSWCEGINLDKASSPSLPNLQRTSHLQNAFGPSSTLHFSLTHWR